MINVGVGLKGIPLRFGTFFGACYKCNQFGHFARDSMVGAPPATEKETTAPVQPTIPVKDRVMDVEAKEDNGGPSETVPPDLLAAATKGATASPDKGK